VASEQDVLQALRQIEDPDLHRDIVTLGFVQDVTVADGRIGVRIVLTTPACPVRNEMKAPGRGAPARAPRR
jgi:ATP-binding protein involved in chromosome partitioning